MKCEFSAELEQEPAVSTAATLFQKLCYENKNNLLAGIIVGGWDKYQGGSVYSIALGGSLVKQPFSIGGSGSTYIYGYCDANFKENMTRDECHQFVRNGKVLVKKLHALFLKFLFFQQFLWQWLVTVAAVVSLELQ